MVDSIFSKWWFWVIIVVLFFTLFTPISIFLKNVLNIQECNAWETDTSLGWANDCPSGNVCVPKDKSVCDGINTQNALICGNAFLSEGGTLENPNKGICRAGAGFP